MKFRTATFVIALALTAVGAAFTSNQEVSAAAPVCKVVGVGSNPRTFAGQGKNTAITYEGNTATVKFEVTGPKDCRQVVTFYSFKTPAADGKPFRSQVQYAKTASKTYGPGTYTMSVEKPECYFQVDLAVGKETFKPGYDFNKRGLLAAFDLGGTESCDEKPPVTPPVTPPETPEVPETPVTPETPKTPETPTAIAETGPEQVLAQMFGAGSLVASAAYYVQSRRR